MPRILSDISIDGLGGLHLSIPDPGGLFSGGLLSGFGVILQLVFGITLLVWVFLTIMAGLAIIRSNGNPEQIQANVKKLKYVWLSVSAVFLFFVVISIVGAVVGYGTPADWGNTLAQCGGYDGPFYFSQVDQQTEYYLSRMNIDVNKGQKAYCCNYNPAANNVTSGNSVFNKENIVNLGITSGGSAWYLPYDNTTAGVASDGTVTLTGSTGSGATGLSGCVEYGKL